MKRFLSMILSICCLCSFFILPINSIESTDKDSVSNTTDRSSSDTFSWSEPLADGIYQIKTPSFQYLTVYDHGYTSGTDVVVKELNHIYATTGTRYDLSQLWRVVCLDDTNLIYSIRSAMMPTLALTVSGTDVNVMSAGISMSTIQSTSAWKIAKNDANTGYLVQNNGDPDKSLSYVYEGDGKNVCIEEYLGSGPQVWGFEGVNLGDCITMNGPCFVKVGESIDLKVGLCSLTALAQTCNFYTSDIDVTVAKITGGTGCRVTGVYEGSAAIQATSYNDTSLTTIFTIYVLPADYEMSLFGFPGTNADGSSHDHTSSLLSMKNTCGAYIGTSNIYADFNSHNLMDEVTPYFATADVAVTHSHGIAGELIIQEGSINVGYHAGQINAKGGYTFGEIDCIALVACYSGATDEDGLNLVDSFFFKGASCAIGFRETIWCVSANQWITNFSSSLNTQLAAGMSLENVNYVLCAEFAAERAPVGSGLQNPYIRHADEY